MVKKIFTLFKLGRKLAKSDILNVVSKFKKPPLVIKILFQILSFSFSNRQKTNLNNTEGERLSKSLQSMGTTFIKLGQFLVTRPDIIGDELAKQLEGLQDRLPAFPLSEAKVIIKKDLGEETFNSIIDLEIFNNEIYVSEFGNHRITKIKLTGESVGWLGDSSENLDKLIWNINGQPVKSDTLVGLNNPFGLRILDKILYVADKNNGRIKIIKSNLFN